MNNQDLTITTKYAEAVLLPCKNIYINKPSFESLTKALIKEGKSINDYFVLDDLRLLNSNDFGKGYGKSIFIRLVNSYPNLIFTPSFSTFDKEDMDSYAGREKMNMDNLNSAPKILMDKFYKKILDDENIPYKVIFDKKYIIITNP